jgi:hypothetical protein
MSVEPACWRLLDPPLSVVVAVPRRRSECLTTAMGVRALAVGTNVVVEVDGWGAWLRCRRFLRRGSLVVEREFVPIPSLQRAAFRVEDAPVARSHFASTLLTTPPRLGCLSPLADLGVALVRVAARTPVLGMVMPGRIVVARRR